MPAVSLLIGLGTARTDLVDRTAGQSPALTSVGKAAAENQKDFSCKAGPSASALLSMTVTTVKHVCYQSTLAIVVLFAAISGTEVWSYAAQTGTKDKQTNPAASEADRLIAEGVAALERNDFAAAEKLFKQALSLSPKNAAATHVSRGARRPGRQSGRSSTPF